MSPGSRHLRITSASHREHRSIRWTANTLFSLAMLVVFCWHGILVQTHFHTNVRPLSAASELASSNGLTHGQSSPDTPDRCQICREAATAGHYLSPTVPALEARIGFASWRPVTPYIRQSGRSRSHAWHSRAPPLFLTH